MEMPAAAMNRKPVTNKPAGTAASETTSGKTLYGMEQLLNAVHCLL
jgi:hypothetical protein